MRVLLTGGGTAGHINPALAIAETVRQNCPGAEIAFVGVRSGKEVDLVPREGYPLHFVNVRGIQRSLSPANVKALWLALTSPYAKSTTRILDEFRPDIVIGTGGFACWPIMAAAARRGIPTALHESNAKPGLAVKQLQGRVDRIWVNFERTAGRIKATDKVLRVGNPLRGGFGSCSRQEARRRLGLRQEERLILSFGGSLGADAVNGAVLELMRDLGTKNPDLRLVHATGKRCYDAFMTEFRGMGLEAYPNCVPLDYIYDMPLQMAAADVVISRAGAMTLSELALMRKACILIPFPKAADNHQYENAKALSDSGAAVLIEEKQLTGGLLTQEVERLLHSPDAADGMASRIADFADSNANQLIWQDILKLTGSV